MIDHHAAARTTLAFRLEAENIAFQMGHLTATFERIASQADELRMRRERAWAAAVDAARIHIATQP